MSEMPHKPRRARADTGKASDYEVGYGRPPLANQFKPGQCGNPRGRPKKPRSLHEAMGRELDRTITVREGGRERRLTKCEVIARRLADDACRGDARAIRLMRDTAVIASPPNGPASASFASAAALPLDLTDRAIIAAFAALIRDGASFPGDMIVDPVLAGLNDDDNAMDPDDLPSPTQH